MVSRFMAKVSIQIPFSEEASLPDIKSSYQTGLAGNCLAKNPGGLDPEVDFYLAG